MRQPDFPPTASLRLQPVKSADGSLRPEFIRDIVSRFGAETFGIVEASDRDFTGEAGFGIVDFGCSMRHSL